MSHTVKISFKLGTVAVINRDCPYTTDAAAPLGFEAWLDQTKFFDTEHVQESQTVVTEMPDNDGDHELRLVMKNKLPEHTQVDADGNIVGDARLVITDLTFDDIPLGYIVTEKSQYFHDRNSTSESPIAEKFHGEMGCNGTVSLKFSTPMYLWLLENM